MTEQREEAINSAEFLLSPINFVGGQPRVQFLPGSYAGGRRAFQERLETWEIRNSDGLETCEGNCDELIKSYGQIIHEGI